MKKYSLIKDNKCKVIKSFICLAFLLCILINPLYSQIVQYPCSMIIENKVYNSGIHDFYFPTKIISPYNSSNLVEYSGTANVTYKAGDEITLNPGFTAGDFSDENSGFETIIDNPIELVLISPGPSSIVNGSVHVNKWEKFEIGFNLPEEYRTAIQNFFFNYYEHPPQPLSPSLNPYADDSLNVEVNLISPTGEQIKRFCFFMREADFIVLLDTSYNGEKRMLSEDFSNPLHKYNWRFRFAPDEVNSAIPWQFSIKIECKQPGLGLSEYQYSGLTFFCDPPLPDNHGFLQVNNVNRRFLKFEDGTPFFGIGENISDLRHSNTQDLFWFPYFYNIFTKLDYDEYMRTLDEMHETGANFARIMIHKSNFAPEWHNMGVYDSITPRWCCDPAQSPKDNYEKYFGNRQYNLWALDKVFEKSRENNIYIQLCMEPFQPIIVYQDFIWGDNIYAYYTYIPDENGSTIAHRSDPVKYFTDPLLKYYFKRKYKYMMARYGYSVNLAIVETFNEIDQTIGFRDCAIEGQTGLCQGNKRNYLASDYPTLKADIYNWHTDILGYLKNTLFEKNTNNANSHLTSVSFTPYAAWPGWYHDEIQTPQDKLTYYNLFNNQYIDITDIHQYPMDYEDQYIYAHYFSTEFVHNFLNINKPFLLGEFCTLGMIHYNTSQTETESTISMELFNNYDVPFHNEIWASAFMGGISTGLSWLWATIHWWKHGNTKYIQYYDDSYNLQQPYMVNNELGEVNGDDPDPLNWLYLPNGDTVTFRNKKIYHNYKPLSNFIQNSALNFDDNLVPKRFYDETVSAECYYYVNDDATKAWGWVHNTEHYWFNKYYYYYNSSFNFNHQNLFGCTVTLNNPEIRLPFPYSQPLETPFIYEVQFYPTRLGASPYLPATALVECDYLHPYIDLGQLIGSLGCDTANADFAFSINRLYLTGEKLCRVNIPERNNFNIVILPNPSDGVFYVSTDSNEEIPVIVSVSNYLGEPVNYRNSVNNGSLLIDLSGNPRGLYLLKISYNNNNYFYKLILL